VIGPAQGIPAGPPTADSLRAVLDSVFAGENYQWTVRRHPLAFLQAWWSAVDRWLESLQASHPSLFNALFWVLVAVLIAIFIHGGWVLARAVHAANRPAGPAGEVTPPPRGADWYRREGARLAGLGRFAEAMQHDFLALVLELDTRQRVRFHPSKTPNEYTYEARLPEEGRGAFRDLVRELYAAAFAGRPCGPDEYTSWQARLDGTWHAAAY
jgi:uncharacterized protein DUF4129